jgi:DNA polymerase-3 subunit alpha
LLDVLQPYRIDEGGCPVRIEYHNGDAKCELALGDKWRVALHDGLLEGLNGWLSRDNVLVEF